MIGNNSCGVHSVMGVRPSTTSRNSIFSPTTAADARWAHERRGARADHRRGRPRGVIYRKLRDLRDRYAALVRERYPRIPRRVSGYNLDQLLPENGFNVARALVGSESTCVIVLGATVRLMHSPPHRALVVIGYPGFVHRGRPRGAYTRIGPIGLEAFQKHVIENMQRKGKESCGRNCCRKAIPG